tara:strand:- start:2174 stop:4372 length:2199 start_codon:yes stop_codon:yes gene_type:complete
MAELNVKLNEKIQKEVFTTARPPFLSADQIDTFSDVIKTNSPFLQDQIKELKTSFPTEFGDISALTEDQINDFTSIATDELQEKLSLYEKIALPDVTSISSTTGFTVIAADPNSARFFERTDTAMKNFFKIASEVDNFNLDLSGELSKLTKMVGNFSKTFIGKISDSLQNGLVSFIDNSMMTQANLIFTTFAAAQIPRPIALKAVKAFQSSLIGPVTKLFDGLGCLTSKVVSAMSGVISDMLTSMTKNMLNAPTCATQQFVGALTNKIADSIDNKVAPLLSPIQNILSPIGAKFPIKDKIMGGIDFMSKVGGLFKCELPEKQTSSFKYTIDGLLKKDLGGGEHKSLLNGAMNAAATTNSFLQKAESGLSKFEQAYGKWSIFGSPVDSGGAHESAFTGGNCYTGNQFACGPANVDFFGGNGGSGAKGNVILGNFLTKFDKDDIYGSLRKTASIIGVEITDPGSGYTSPPLISFGDKCDQGYGAYGKANIDKNPNSPTYGQVTSVTMTSIGENYPVDASKTTVNGQFPEVFIDDIIIEDPGSNYQEGDSISDDIRPVIETNPESRNFGRIVAIEIVNQIPYNRFPKMRVKSETGFGAVIRPIMSTIKTQVTPDEVVENGAIRTDTALRDIQGRKVSQVFKVIQCVGTYPATTIIPLTPKKPIIQDVEETPEPPTPETNVPDTTTTPVQTVTISDTTTTPVSAPSQQATGQSNTPPPSSPPSGGGSEGSGGGYGY